MSDGGPAHFKTRRSLFMMKEFAKELKIEINWHFFASNHGKGVCDGKHGVDKRMLRQRALAGQDIRTLNHYIAVISAVANTRLVFAVKGAESNDGYDCTKFKEVRKYHEFIFRSDTEDIELREMTGQGRVSRQTISPLAAPLAIDEEEEILEEAVPLDEMVTAIVAGMDEFPFDYTDPRLINADSSLNTDWMLLDPLLQPLPGQTIESLQHNSE